ncbi:MAG: diaminopimelate decarboxylase [Proteobacteria bacterium]|nr:diaminopimelate decarboxylase [Pseudomonadota bacterium]
MHYFQYKRNSLYAEGVPISKIAKAVGTPAYIYSKKTLKRHYNAFNDAFSTVDNIICYSVKANSNLSVLSTFAEEGSGFDIVSGGELFRALKAGAKPKRIVFSGVGKREDEIEYALKSNILLFNVESPSELKLINKVAGRLKRKAGIAIRVNPNVDAKTHPYISTGLKKNKFGIETKEAFEQYIYARKSLKNLDLLGVDCHIGSQITELGPFEDALKKAKTFIGKLRKEGIDISYLDLGGGLGITYEDEKAPLPSKYGEAVIEATKGLGVTLIFEPGRAIAGNAGILVTKVLYTKQGSKKRFVIVDAGMNDLGRPSLYGSYHGVTPVKAPLRGARKVKADIVGPICESGDFLAQDRMLPELKDGDLISIMSAGAYGFTMSSNYNSRLRAAEVMVDDKKFSVIRKRESFADLINGEALPKKKKKGTKKKI